MFEQFPKTKQTIQFCGSLQEHKNEMVLSYVSHMRAQNPNIALETLYDDAETFLTDREYATSSMAARLFDTTRFDGTDFECMKQTLPAVVINDRRLKGRAKRLLSLADSAFGDRAHPRGLYDIDYITAHEMGHLVDNAYRVRYDERIEILYSNSSREELRTGHRMTAELCAYAWNNAAYREYLAFEKEIIPENLRRSDFLLWFNGLGNILLRRIPAVLYENSQSIEKKVSAFGEFIAESYAEAVTQNEPRQLSKAVFRIIDKIKKAGDTSV